MGPGGFGLATLGMGGSCAWARATGVITTHKSNAQGFIFMNALL